MRQHIVHGLNRENDRLGDNHLPFMYIVQRPSIEQSTPLWIPNDHQSIHPWFNIILAVFKKQYCQKHWEHLHLVYIVHLVDGMGWMRYFSCSHPLIHFNSSQCPVNSVKSIFCWWHFLCESLDHLCHRLCDKPSVTSKRDSGTLSESTFVLDLKETFSWSLLIEFFYCLNRHLNFRIKMNFHSTSIYISNLCPNNTQA